MKRAKPKQAKLCVHLIPKDEEQCNNKEKKKKKKPRFERRDLRNKTWSR